MVGALYADGRRRDGEPPAPELREALATQVAACLQNARLFERATGDLLTGLPNNSAFMYHLGCALEDPAADKQFGVLLLDLDDFKRINAAAGAAAGDAALSDIAGTLHEVLRSDGLLARFGSDKFAVLLPHDAAHPIDVRLRDVAERARAAIRTKRFYQVGLTACIGAVGFGGGGRQRPQDVIARADDALATARRRGDGQLEVAAPFAPP